MEKLIHYNYNNNQVIMNGASSKIIKHLLD